MTSNIGGGGQTVSRFPSFLPLIKDLGKENIGILLNYHYLSFYKKEGERRTQRMVFNGKDLDRLNHEDITFKDFFKGFNVNGIDSFISNSEDDYDFEILLDSGSGKILADAILYYDLDYKKSKELLFDLVEHHIDFAYKKGSDYVIAMDFCKKNTYKNDEGRSLNYQKIINSLLTDQEVQNDLLIKTLEIVNNRKYNLKVFAPIHGENHDNFLDHYNAIIELEKTSNYKFSGFALGGLSSLSSGKIGKIVKEIRDSGECRDVHILGSSGIKKIPVLMSAGANFFDCHTPWRRANDSDSKFCMPLINSSLELLTDVSRSYKNIGSSNLILNNYECDCPICSNFNNIEIERLLNNRKNNVEGFYFAKLLIYFHGVYQYSYLMKKIELLNQHNDLDKFISSIDNVELRNDLNKNMELIQ